MAVILNFSGSMLLILLIIVFCLEPTMFPTEVLNSNVCVLPSFVLSIDIKIC